jgi:hypothetical protein
LPPQKSLRISLRPLASTASVFLLTAAAWAQTAPTPDAKPEALPPPTGEVLFERHTDSAQPPALTGGQGETPEVTDAERSALRITADDLDARLTPATAHLGMRARLTLKNEGAAPLTHLTLQVSSTLTWESATLLPAHIPLAVAQHLLDTDADHTGAARELVLTLPAPLAVGDSVTLDTFYEGEIAADATRLTRIGATPAQAAATDWDAITAQGTALRGFGNVLWYPVASPALFLGDGAKLFQAIAAARLRDETATIRLRLAVEYRGEPPVAAYFCGRRAALQALPDDPDMPTAEGAGVASAEFADGPIGFRLPSLFLIDHNETLIAPLPASASSSSAGASGSPAEAEPAGPALLAVETSDDGALPRLADSALSIAPLLQQWLGPRPLSALTLLDHTGEPFEDGPLVVAPAATLAASSSSGALAHSLTHAWVQTGQPWMDEGLAQFLALLFTEQQQGRAAMVAQLTDLLQPLALAEPAFTAGQIADGTPAGQSILHTADELYYRRKAAAVWLMLRGIVGDGALAAALTTLHAQPVSQASAADQAAAFERLLERTSGKDLAWFFRDWVLHDRGLPDLSIVEVAPRTLPAGKGHDSGWLVAVTVHNDGAAEAEVPIIIRSGSYSTTKRLRVPAFGNVTDRVVVEAAPTEVVVNDGITPETTASVHTQAVVLNP